MLYKKPYQIRSVSLYAFPSSSTQNVILDTDGSVFVKSMSLSKANIIAIL